MPGVSTYPKCGLTIRSGGRPRAYREEISFQTKPEIALQQIRTALDREIPTAPVLADAGYGNDTGFRDGITELGLLYVVGIQSSVSVWKPGQAPLPKRKWKGIGRPTKLLRRDGQHNPLAVRELAMSLPASAWKTVSWRQGTRKPLRSRFAALRLRPAHRDYESSEPRPEEWLLIEWPKAEAEPTKYWLSTLPVDTPLADLVRLAKQRWIIERDYEELKQELGLGHYEGRGWRGFHHHATLCIAAYGFLVAERSRFSPSARAGQVDLPVARNAAQVPPSGFAPCAWSGITPGPLLRFDKPSHEFCSDNSRVVLFVELPFYNTVVLGRDPANYGRQVAPRDYRREVGRLTATRASSHFRSSERIVSALSGSQAGNDSARHVLDSMLYFGRDLGSGLESSSLDPVDLEPRRKTIQNVSQFDRLCHAKAMGGSSCLDGSQRLPGVPRLHGAHRRTGHHRIDHDHIVGAPPGLDEIRSFATARFCLYAKIAQSLRDQDSGPIVASLPIPAANDEHASVPGVFTLHHELQKVGGAGNARVITSHRLLAFPGRFFERPSHQLRRILAKIILDPFLVLGGRRHDLGSDDQSFFIQGVAVIQNAARCLSDRLTHADPVGDLDSGYGRRLVFVE